MKRRSIAYRNPIMPALALLIASSLSAHAEDTKLGWSREAIVGVATSPDYVGSDTNRAKPLLGASISYTSQDYGVAGLGLKGLYWTFLNHDDYHVGVALSGDPGRIDHRDSGVFGSRPGSNRLAGMGSVDSTAVLSAYGDVKLGPVSLGLRANHAMSSYKGSSVAFSVSSAPYQLQPGTTLVGSASVDWIDDKAAQAYFGVTSAQAARSAFAAYTPKAGIAQSSLGLVVNQELTRDWKLMGEVRATELQGDAGRSPLVQRKTQPSAGLAVLYSF